MPLLDALVSGKRFFTHCLRVAGMGESDVEQRIGRIYSAEPNVATTILSAPGDIQIHLRAEAEAEDRARAIAEALGERIRAELGRAVYSVDGVPLDQTLARLLRQRGIKVGVAESCTEACWQPS